MRWLTATCIAWHNYKSSEHHNNTKVKNTHTTACFSLAFLITLLLLAAGKKQKKSRVFSWPRRISSLATYTSATTAGHKEIACFVAHNFLLPPPFPLACSVYPPCTTVPSASQSLFSATIHVSATPLAVYPTHHLLYTLCRCLSPRESGVRRHRMCAELYHSSRLANWGVLSGGISGMEYHDPCNPTDTSAYFTIYMDAACTEALNTQQVPLNQPSCTGGAGKSWFISCVADGKTPASVSKRKSHTLHQKLKINQEVKAAPTSHYAQATGPRHSHMKPHSLARPHRHTNSTSGYPPLPLERHTVFFHYTSTTTPDDRLAIDTLYRSIPQKSTYVVSIEGNAPNNPPNSQEGFQQNIDEAYITTFLNTQDRDFFVGRPFTYPFGRYSPHSSSNSACRCRCTR